MNMVLFKRMWNIINPVRSFIIDWTLSSNWLLLRFEVLARFYRMLDILVGIF